MALCLHAEKTSFLELIPSNPWLNRIWNFSFMQRMHFSVMGENGSPLSNIFHVTSNFFLLCLRSQIKLLSDVGFVPSVLKDCLCVPKRALKVVEH